MRTNGQQGAVLVVVLVSLLIITMVGIATSKNAQFQVRHSTAFNRHFENDVLADDAHRCVFDMFRNNQNTFYDWTSELFNNRKSYANVSGSSDIDEASGAFTEQGLGASSGVSFAGVTNNGCFTASDGSLYDGRHTTADYSFYCGHVNAGGFKEDAGGGTNSAGFADYTFVTIGESRSTQTGGPATMHASVWHMRAPAPGGVVTQDDLDRLRPPDGVAWVCNI